MGLLNLVEQNDGVWLATYSFGQLSAFLISHIARRCTHHSAYGVLLAILAHVYAYERCLAAEHFHGQTLGQVGFAHTGWSHEQEGANGAVGVFQSHSASLYGTCHLQYGIVLTNYAAFEVLFQLAQTAVLLVSYAVSRNTGHYAHHLCHGLCRHLGVVLLLLLHPCLLELLELFGLHLQFIAKVRGRLVVLCLYGHVLPFLYVAQFCFQIVDFHVGGDVEDVHACTALVHCVDSLVGEGTVAHVALCQVHACLKRLIGVLHLVVLFIGRAQTVQYLQGFLGSGLCHDDFLESPLQCSVLLYGLSEFVYGGGANALHLAACKGRLEHIGCIHASLRTASTDDGVYFVYVYDYVGIGFQFHEQVAHAFLKLSAELRSCHHAGHVQCENALAPQLARHLTLYDSLCQSLHNGALAHTGFANEYGIVLLSARQDLCYALHLLLSSHHGVQFAFACLLRQVYAEIVQDWGAALVCLLFRQGGGVAFLSSAHLISLIALCLVIIIVVCLAVSAPCFSVEFFAGQAMLLQQLLYGASLVFQHSLQQVLGIHFLGMLRTCFQNTQAHQACCFPVQLHAVLIGYHLHFLLSSHLFQISLQRKQVGLYLMHQPCCLADILSQHSKKQVFG